MFNTGAAWRRWVGIPLAVLTGVLAFATTPSTAAEKFRFFEETAEAFWVMPHECADGSIAQATLLVRSTRDLESPDTGDSDPTVRVQFLAVCPDGTSFSWAAPAAPATITSTENLKTVTASGTGIATDNLGGTHSVSFDVTWTGVGKVETTLNGPGSKRRQREASATGQVIFDGDVLVNGEANHPTRPAPFIRVDTEK